MIRTSSRWAPLLFHVMLLARFIAVPCLGQLDRGTITGTVTDVSGAVVPGIKITIRNTANNTTYRSATNGAGDYTVANLPSGVYEVKYEAAGLKTLVRSNVPVAVSETTRLDPSLQVGQSTDTITVAADASVLQTDSP